MNIQRKEFVYTGEKTVQKVTDLYGHKWTRAVEVEQPFGEFMSGVQEFVNGIGQERLVNICEYPTHRRVFGDDGVDVIIVWYWQ